MDDHLFAGEVHQAAALKRQQVRFTREGWIWLGVVIAMWFIGWLKGINLIIFLAYLLLAMWAFNWWTSRRALRGLSARRVLPGRIFADEATAWQIEVDGLAHKQQNWTLHDASPSHAVAWFVTGEAPGEQARLRAEVTFADRGTVNCRPLVATSSVPFGLAQKRLEFESQDQVVVYPAVGQVNLPRLRRWLMQSSRPDERMHRSRRRLAQDVEFHGLRSFRPGDSPRWIHWRTSARRAELMVREFDQGSHYDLLLMVEAFERKNAPLHLEAAISLAASIAWQWARDGNDRVVLAVAGRDVAVRATNAGRDSAAEALTCLADVQGSPNPNLDQLATRLDELSLPSGPALFVSSRECAGDLDALSARLHRPLAFLSAARLPSFYAPPGARSSVPDDRGESFEPPEWNDSPVSRLRNETVQAVITPR
jgi:uncharacterized protein (DUF58 family)